MKTSRLLVLCVCLMVGMACVGAGTVGVSALGHVGTFRETFYSIGWEDGWVTESAPGSGVGGPPVSTGTNLRVGSDESQRQYRSILSFNTATLPSKAIIIAAKLTLNQSGSTVGMGNPFIDFRGLLIDIKLGAFGAAGLESTDFQAESDVSSLGPYKPPLTGTYEFALGKAAYPYINKWAIYSGLTQLRLRFKLKDREDRRANYIPFWSGESSTESLRPRLVIEYRLPSRTQVGWVP